MDDDNDNNAPGRPPACDSCRSRKIKCNREVPCSSCIAWKATCQTTIRPRERKQRVLISHKYENEFRDLNRKLENLSVTLQSFVENAKPGDLGSQTLHSQVADVLASVKQDHDEALFLGESSFPVQWKGVAQNYHELTDSPSNSDGSGSMNTTINLEKEQPKSSFSRVCPGPPNPETLSSNFPQLAQLPLLPTNNVLNVLRIAKVYPQNVWIDFPFLSIERATIMCQKLFFPTEDYSIATYIIVNSYLTYLFRDMDKEIAEKINMTKDEQYKCADVCSTNVAVAMRLWNLAVEPSYENIEALVLGSFILMEESHMFRAFTCIGFVARLLQDAGFHRQSSLEGLSIDERRHRKWLFWTAYSFDHALSLNFGRAAHIQDWDITVEPPDFSPEEKLHGKQILFWLDLARLHGQIYERLYSPRGLQMLQSARTATAQELAAVAHGLREQFYPFYVQIQRQHHYRGATAATQVALWSTITMIYKCIPPNTAVIESTPNPLQYSEDCIGAARTALKTLDETWEGIEESGSEVWRMFIHWCLIGCPFVPYLVIFANAMNVPNNISDYQLLRQTGRTIATAASRSKGLVKLNKICQSFLNVAKSRYEPSLSQTGLQGERQDAVPQQEMLPLEPMLPDDFGLNEIDTSAFSFMDFSMLDGWELGPGGAESAREMNSYFEQLPHTGFMGPSG